MIIGGDFVKISVALCTYNGEKYIRQQLESICKQTRKIDEIIISDDHSIDHTLDICRQVLNQYDIHYHIIINNPALRVMRNFQQCFSLCTGDVIFSCDQDDVWNERKVEFIMNEFESNSDIKMIATNAILIDGNGNKMNLTLRESIGFHIDKKNKQFLPNLLKTFCITGATMAFYKTFESQYFYLSQYWLHDGWLALAAALTNQFLYLDDPLTKYRLHGNNVCGIGYDNILQSGTIKKLARKKKLTLFKTVITCPYYYEDLAAEKYKMYKEIMDFFDDHKIDMIDINQAELISCINFWKQRLEIKNIDFKTLRNMIKHFKAFDAYRKYTESEYFKYYDYYFWIVYHILPRKKHERR